MTDDLVRHRSAERESLVRVLADKFKRDRDLLLARASSDDAYDRFNTIRRIRMLLRALRGIGISVDETVLPKRRRKMDQTPPT